MDIFSDNKHQFCERVKETDIKDGFDRLRFRVSFVQEGNRYAVRVSSFTHGAAGTVVLEKFFNTKAAAQHFYEKTLIDYGTVVDSDSRQHQSVKAFEKRINYKKIVPKCCQTCKWCRKINAHENIFNDDCPGTRFVCCNSELFAPKRPHHSVGHDICAPAGHEHGHDRPGFQIDMQPAVDPLGVCDSYAPKKLPDAMNINGHSDWIWEHHDCMPGHVTESVIKFEIGQAMAPVENKLNQSIDKKFDEKAGELVDAKVDAAEKRLDTLFDRKIDDASRTLSNDFDVKLNNTRSDCLKKIYCLDKKFDAKLDEVKTDVLYTVDLSATKLQHQMHLLQAKTDCKLKCLKTDIDCSLNNTKTELSAKIDAFGIQLDGIRDGIGEQVQQSVNKYMDNNGENLVTNVISSANESDTPVKTVLQEIITNIITSVIAVQDGGGADGYQEDGYNRDYNDDGIIDSASDELAKLVDGGGA